MNDQIMKDKVRTSQAIVVEGRDDVTAVSQACDSLIIPTHGFGITAETWQVLAKAYEEKGLIILTDPDHSGEEIRRMLNEKFPGSVNCYVARDKATAGTDIGIENSSPEVIAEAVMKALELDGRTAAPVDADEEVTMKDLTEMGLAGSAGSAERRAAVCAALGIGYGNAGAMVRKLRGFGIGRDELAEAVRKCTAEKTG